MSYQATIFNVMIASPGDVPRERVIAREVIMEWNTINSYDRKFLLQPIGWETHSAPSMEETAQRVINSQVLDHADLLVAIFWTRLGSPTGEFASGTVEEIERHIKAGKPAMIYFSSTPVAPDSIDQNQYSALVAFRESLKTRGLVSFFADIADFKEQLFRHLSQTAIREFAAADSSSEIPPAPLIRHPKVNEDARELLIAAVNDKHGMISYARYMSGSEMWAGPRNFIADHSPRNIARWDHALAELESLGFVADAGYKREVFSVTNAGYLFAESIGVKPES